MIGEKQTQREEKRLEKNERPAARVWECAQDAMYRAAYAVLGDRHDAEDAVMDAMTRIVRKESVFSGLTCNDMRALAVIYSRNAAINLYNANRKRPYPVPELPESPDMTSVEDEAAANDSAARLLCLIGQMPPSYRDALLLRIRFGMSVSRIAEVLGIEAGAVRTRLSRARGWLKKHEGRE